MSSALAFSSDDEGGQGEQKSLKVVLLGDSGAGKSAICCRFAQLAFPQKYTQTSGVDFYSRRIAMPRNVSVLLQLWDVGGHNLTSPSMLNTYVFDAQAVLFVYDVTNSQSFDNLTDWMVAANKICGKPIARMALVGNKTDNEHRRVVKVDRHNKLAEQNLLSAFYVSAKTGDAIDLMFKKTAAEVLGIQLTKAEQEWNVNGAQAQIAAADRSQGNNCRQKEEEEKQRRQSKVGEEANGAEVKTANAKESAKTRKKSTVCSVQ